MNEVREYRVFFSRPPIIGGLGCMGCLFVMGGILGVLLFGWQQILGV